MLLIAFGKSLPRLLCHQPLISGNAFYLYAAPAHCYLRIGKKLFCFAEIFVRLEINLFIVKQAAYIAHHHIIIHAGCQGHNLTVPKHIEHTFNRFFKSDSLV